MEEVYIIEAALFSAGRALTIDQIAEATDVGKKKVQKLLDQLACLYREREGSLEVISIGDRYTMRLRPVYAEHAARLAQMEIPLKVLKTAALIAYHQPIRQSQLVMMVGSKAYDHVKELHDLGLVRVRKEGQTKVLTTSPRFQEYFGIDAVDRQGIKQWLAKKVGLDPESVEKTLDSYVPADGSKQED